MCGIAGFASSSGTFDTAVIIRKMTDLIAHRGPDAEGIYLTPDIALGHRRLSIIDVSEASNEPMWDYSGRFVIVFNGEIYNYKELKATIPSYPFRTKSDTEVVLAFFAQHGESCLQFFNGMFAFAIWDTLTKRLFLARDRAGKKPLYYYQQKELFLFSSEIRSILHSGVFTPTLANGAIASFLQYQTNLNDQSMVSGVHQLKAGHFAWVENATMSQQAYWSYANVSPSEDSLEQAQSKVRDLFIDAVRLRMIADVPIGAFLSGGIDSSLVVACMSELSSHPVSTFTLSFDDKKFDEADFARQVAGLYRTHHTRILIKPDELLDSLPEMMASMDTPSGDGPNTYLISKYTRSKGVKVALSGLGGDELFAGYRHFTMYNTLMKYRWLAQLPLASRKTIAKILSNFFASSKWNKTSQLLSLRSWTWEEIYPVFRTAYANQELRKILRHSTTDISTEASLKSIRQTVEWMEGISFCTIGELELYTRDVLLRDTDQMSMAHALEVRAPFFDYRLMEYTLSLPDALKYPHTPKQLLVNSFSDYLPKNISDRKKMGFVLPWSSWLRRELKPMAEGHIRYLAERPEFNTSGVLAKWNQFSSGDTSVLPSRIWQLVVLSHWLQRHQL